MTVILGIDPGSRKTGFGLISVDRNKPHYVSSGTIHLPSKESLSVRLKVLFESLTEVIDTYQPQVAAHAHHHYRASKVIEANNAESLMVALDRQQRGGELARMLGGAQVTDQTLSHASELLSLASN